MTWSVSYGLIYTVRIPICVQNSDRHAGPASKLKVWSTRGFVLVAGFSIIQMDISERKDGDYSNFRFFLCVNSVSNAENFLLLFLHFCQIYK